ncbi:ABC transporter permease [Jeotgalibaca caeni]|uniref:ABC transporter permease n=1 Tax=Jeotgalibaca caeni TaxID=3028623 RepID=UPI00237DA269|nr:ABC transporter permease [Jeotgalibaca caeni]MDE1547638.1 ABC transporter permease [Jeotgalibaca caeni]
MNKFWVIVGQVYKKNVKSVGFITMMLSPLILIGIVAAIIFFIDNMEQEIPQIAVLSESSEVVELLQAENEYYNVDSTIETQEAAESAMEAGGLDGYLTVANQNGALTASYVSLPDSETLDMAYLTNQLSGLQLNLQSSELGLSPETAQTLLTPPVIETRTVSIDEGEVVEGDSADQGLKLAAAYAICIAIFMFIMTYSSIIAEEIASEKGTRIMEVVLSSVSATTHFFGKLVAIFFICLTQIGFYAVIIAIALQLDFVQNLLPEGLDLVATLRGIVGSSLYYFIMGIFLYAVVAAFLGSLVTKSEDVSKAVSPIVFIALMGFYGGMFALASTTHPIIKIGSHVPFFTPFIMPFRIAAETASTTEIGISMVVMLAFTVLITLLSLMLYRSNVLIYSDATMGKMIRTSWRNVRNERRASQNN